MGLSQVEAVKRLNHKLTDEKIKVGLSGPSTVVEQGCRACPLPRIPITCLSVYSDIKAECSYTHLIPPSTYFVTDYTSKSHTACQVVTSNKLMVDVMLE